MKVVKIAVGIARGLTILLCVLAFTLQSPEQSQYDKTVEMLMEQEGISSVQELEARFPVLASIQFCMHRIDHLTQLIQTKTRSLAPSVTEEETAQLEYYMRKIHQLQQEVSTELSGLLTHYEGVQP